MKNRRRGGTMLLFFALVAGCGASSGGGGSSGTSCATICAHLATGMCSAANSQCETQCVSEYSAVPSTCNDLLSALKACRASAAVTCDTSGAPVTASCDAQQTALADCVRNPPAPPPMQQPPSAATCEGVCARGNATCTSPDTSCVAQCNALLSTPSCASQMRAVLQCASTATISCSSSGRPRVNGCDAQGAALTACVNP